MSTATTTITYTAPQAGPSADLRLTLAQDPVDKRSGLLQADVDRMLALVLSGQSARRYKPARCAAWIRETVVGADLVVHAWPVPEDLEYTFEAVGCEAAEPTRPSSSPSARWPKRAPSWPLSEVPSERPAHRPGVRLAVRRPRRRRPAHHSQPLGATP